MARSPSTKLNVVKGSVTPVYVFSGVSAAVRRSRQLLVIEGRLFLLGCGVDDDEVVAALDGAAIPEARCLLDPGRRFGDAERYTLILVAQPIAR